MICLVGYGKCFWFIEIVFKFRKILNLLWYELYGIIFVGLCILWKFCSFKLVVGFEGF